MILIALSAFAGFLGALLGLGGGIIIVPLLTLAYGVSIREAVATSLVAIVATSSTAAAAYLKERLTNVRLAIFLEIGTVSGGIVGFLVSGILKPAFLFILFGAFLLLSAAMMFRQRHAIASPQPSNSWSQRFALDGPDYHVQKPWWGLFGMFFAGILSALLGIGSGILKVLAMDHLMKLPLKVSSATSNFMIGVTAAASCGAYLLSGEVEVAHTAPVVIGVMVGSFLGAKAMPKVKVSWLKILFVIVLTVVSLQMIWRGWQLWN